MRATDQLHRFRSPVLAILLFVAAMGGTADAQKPLVPHPRDTPAISEPVSWLLFVDDLHLDFRNTGRIRDLLGMVSAELIRDGDSVAMRSTGPSGVTLELTRERSLLTSTIRKVSGNGLRLSDVVHTWWPGVVTIEPANSNARRTEQWIRRDVALTAARDALVVLERAPDLRTCMLYVSNGYELDDPHRQRVVDLARVAREIGVRIIAVDPRGLNGAQATDPIAEPAVWQAHLTATRDSLRLLSESTAGVLVFEDQTLVETLKEAHRVVRRP